MKTKTEIYMDNGATTKVDEAVIKEINHYLDTEYGNPGSIHEKGRNAFKALERAREVIAKEINAKEDEIIFTSGATESNNLALNILSKGDHLIISSIEHHSIDILAKNLEQKGIEVSRVKVDNQGFVDVYDLKNKIKENTRLISIIHANNEIGTIQDLKIIGDICKEEEILFHSDCVQSFKKEKIDVDEFNLAMISISAHKIHGPKGVGALYCRNDVKLTPLIYGGGQEDKKRAGTENVPGIMGFKKAVEQNYDYNKIKEIRDYFVKKVEKEIEDIKFNGSKEKRLVNNANISFRYIEGESLLMSLDMDGIRVSTGSACSSKSLKASHVLLAIGLDHETAHGSLRFTFSKYNTKKEVDYVVDSLKKAVKRLREVSAIK